MQTTVATHVPAASTISEHVRALRSAFDSGRTRPIAWRTRQLDGILRFCREREHEILEALAADLGKPEVEGWLAETGFLATDVKHVKKHLAEWMKPERVSTPIVAQPGKSEIHKEPLGVVLIIAPWNYPLQLALAPLIGAVAAGNCAIVKPSELAPATSAVIARRLPEYVDPGCIRVVEGGVPETQALLAERFDHVFYTGNGTVGRIVMEAAAKHLTPVTLELGGKSPAIVDRGVDLDVVARRLVWGKFFNAGQTCVAPDYVLVDDRMHDALVNRLVSTVRELYGDDPRSSTSYARIVNARHHRRLMGLLPGSGDVACGGVGDEATRYLAPTVLKNVPEDSPVMRDEIFGPILPVLSVPHVDAAVSFVNARPKPLALYLFSEDGRVQERVLDRTSSGGVTLNHVWLHLGVPELPFGGVGPSGMGAYHGRGSFDTFTHRKAVLRKTLGFEPPILLPPYSETKTRWLRRLLG